MEGTQIIKPTKRIAAIDLGTNSFHAVIVDIYSDGSYQTVDKLKEMIILAEKGLRDYLSEDAMQRGIEALSRIKFLCDSLEVEEILAYATSAIREAKNGGDFIQRAIEEVDIKIRAIPGTLEAEIIGIAIKHSIALDKEKVLMVDIGGGSVEFIIANQDEFFYHESFKLGVARMAAQFVENDPVTDSEIDQLNAHFEETLTDLKSEIINQNVKTIIGSSGTMENIAAMIIGRKTKTPVLTLNELTYSAEDFQEFYAEFIKMNAEERAKQSGLEEKRVDIIIPGMVLVKFLLIDFNLQEIKISEAALRDGMILKYIEKEKPNLSTVAQFPNPRERSVFELLRKCSWMEAHSRHVAKLAMQIFDEFRSDLKLEETDRELLKYACYMHDIGYYISYKRHHKHALYLILNAELKGFSSEEINIMAHVARYHRRSGPKKRHKEYKKLPKSLKKKITKLSAILRVADGLDRSHFQNVHTLKIEKSPSEIHFSAFTHSDPELEIWGAERKKNILEKVTQKEVRVSAAIRKA